MLKMCLLLLASALCCFAQIPFPTGTTINWSRSIVGVPAAAGVSGGGIPYRTTIYCNVVNSVPGTNTVADPTGVNDNSRLFQFIVNECPSNEVIYIPAGNYLITNSISIQSSDGVKGNGITIRGAGTNTVLHGLLNSSIDLFNIGGYYNNGGQQIVSGATSGSTSVTCAGISPSLFYENNAIIIIGQSNDMPYVHGLINQGQGQIPNPVTTNLQTQTVWVTSTNAGNVINFWPPLSFDFTNNSVVSYKYYSGRGCIFTGFEDLKIQEDTNAYADLFFDKCYGCWVRDVECAYVDAVHIYVDHSVNCEFRECYTHDFYGAGGADTGEGIELYINDTGCLIEDNIGYHVFPSINTSGGSDGNVIAYNFSVATHSGSVVAGADFDCNHGQHNVNNLWEGNVGSMFQNDGFFGSCSWQTLYRNYFSGVNYESNTIYYGLRCIDLTHWSSGFNIVNNVLGYPGWVAAGGGWSPGSTNGYSYSIPVIYRFGYPEIGNNGYSNIFGPNPTTIRFGDYDTAVQTNNFFLHNWEYCSNMIDNPVGLGTNLPASLFYTNQPSWWTNSQIPWPPIGADLSPMISMIPAQARWYNIVYPPYRVPFH